jgi:hypothetical protein
MHVKVRIRRFGNVSTQRWRLPRRRIIGWLALTAVALSPTMASGAPEKDKQAMPGMSESQLFARVQEIPALLAANKLTVKRIPNPHWRRDACNACHAGAPVKGNAHLRDNDVNRSCNLCHEALSPHSYIHPVGMPVPKEMEPLMPKSFRDAHRRGGNKITCITCHDLPIQCLPERARERGLNPLYFRGGPYRARTELCFRCHDAKAYARLNPHDQLSDAGKVREASCLVCHDDVPDREKAKGIENVSFNVKGDLTVLCTGCHLTIPHPGGAMSFSHGKEGLNHLRVPSKFVQARLAQSRKRPETHLPLDPGNGKVFCGTCHNVHEKGLLEGAAGRGADSKQRLRQPDMCGLCHDK